MAKVRTTTRPISEKTLEDKADRKMGFVQVAEAPSRRSAGSSAEQKPPAKKNG